jgi:ElaB/YqjD/DUF883 family membrane-anchored ribosome-binding protein
MVVAETLAGIALVNSAVKGIKSAIGTAKDVSEIAEDIDKLFKGSSQVAKSKAPNPILAKWDSVLKRKLGDNADKFSIGNVAKAHIERKMADEALEQMSMLINKRFGYGTWDNIILEQKELIEKHKSAKKKERERKEKQLEAAFQIIKNILVLLIGTVAIIGIVFWAKTK